MARCGGRSRRNGRTWSVEDINKLPLFLAGMTDRPFCAIVPHLFGTTAFEEAPWPSAAIVWAAERPLPRAYRRAGFHAISESTRDDLVARGVAAPAFGSSIPGVDCRTLRAGQGWTRDTDSRLLVRWTAEAL